MLASLPVAVSSMVAAQPTPTARQTATGSAKEEIEQVMTRLSRQIEAARAP
jgi:hypothetical protein